MQEYRHAGLISRSCALFPVGRKLASNPPGTSGWVQTDSFARFSAMFHLAKNAPSTKLQVGEQYIQKDSKNIIYIQISIDSQESTYRKEKLHFGSEKKKHLKHLMYRKMSNKLANPSITFIP
jgi:hypothetical protein